MSNKAVKRKFEEKEVELEENYHHKERYCKLKQQHPSELP